jgi:polyferredoxin
MTLVVSARPPETRFDRLLHDTGEWLARHQRVLRRVQWIVIAAYAVLVAVPAFLPLPPASAHLWSDLTLFAQFAFWGVWWPFVLLSMVFVGRAWCGLLCPEGAISEIVSERGRGLATPSWMRWKGWPFAAFALTTIYGQMVSVYQYPKPVLVVLGGSTAGAIVVGYLYGRNKRVWCRFLCPVNGVFGLLAKLAPFHFRVDQTAWRNAPRRMITPTNVNCAPLVPIRTMKGASACHMCGRCSGFKGAISLARRSSMQEIVEVAGQEPKPWETVLILFGLMGIAAGAFLWTSSDLYVAVKQRLADWLIAHGGTMLLEPILPWWILTNYPAQNDVLTPLDGFVLVGYIVCAGALIGGAAALCLALASRTTGQGGARRVFHHLAQGLIPLAACGVFLGLSAITVTMLRNEGFALPFVGPLRAVLLTGAALWAAWFGWQILGRYAAGFTRIASFAAYLGAVAIGTASWALLFWGVA